MYFQKCLRRTNVSLVCITLAIAMTLQIASAQQPSYLDEGEGDFRGEESILREKDEDERYFRRDEESSIREKMERVRKEIDRLNKDLKANIEYLRELANQLRRRVEDQSRDLKMAINDAANEIEELKRARAPEEKIERLIRQIDEWKRKLEELHRPTDEFFGGQGRSRVIVFRLHHAPAEHIGEIVESFLSDNGIIRVDERTNSLIIREIEQNWPDIEMILHELDQPEGQPVAQEFMPPEQGHEFANLLEVTDESIIVRFQEHSEWQEVELWIPFRERDDGEWDRDQEMMEQVRKLEMGAQIEVEWERHGDDNRFWIAWIGYQDEEVPVEEIRELGEIRELMEHAMQDVSPEEALARFENILEHDPDLRTPQGKGAQIMVGVNLMKLGKLEEAKNAIELGLKQFPEDYRGVWMIRGCEALGHIYRERDELDGAIELYQHAIRLYAPDYFRERDVELYPIVAAQKAIRLELARCYAQTDRMEQAIKTLESAIEMEEEIPNLDARAHLFLGELRMELDDREAAKNEFRKLLDLAEKPDAEIDDGVVKKAKVNLETLGEN